MSQESMQVVVTGKLDKFEIGDAAGLAMARAFFPEDKPEDAVQDAPIDPTLSEQVITGEYDAVLDDALGGEADTTDWADYLHREQHVAGLDELDEEDTDEPFGRAGLFTTGTSTVKDDQIRALQRFDRWQDENTAQPERAGFFRRNMSKVVIAAGALIASTAVILGVGMSDRDATTEIADPVTAPFEETTTTEAVTPSTTAPETTTSTVLQPEQNFAQPEVGKAPTLTPPAFVEAEGVSKVFNIAVGDTVWDILQVELTDQEAGAVDFDPEVTRTIFTLMDQIAVTNGFGTDTDKLSGLDPGFDLQLSEESTRVIADFRASRGLV